MGAKLQPHSPVRLQTDTSKHTSNNHLNLLKSADFTRNV